MPPPRRGHGILDDPERRRARGTGRHVKPKHPAIDRPSDTCQAHATDIWRSDTVKPYATDIRAATLSSPRHGHPASDTCQAHATDIPAQRHLSKPTSRTSGPATTPPGLRGLSIAINNVAAHKPQANSNALTALLTASARGSSNTQHPRASLSLNLH